MMKGDIRVGGCFGGSGLSRLRNAEKEKKKEEEETVAITIGVVCALVFSCSHFDCIYLYSRLVI